MCYLFSFNLFFLFDFINEYKTAKMPPTPTTVNNTVPIPPVSGNNEPLLLFTVTSLPVTVTSVPLFLEDASIVIVVGVVNLLYPSGAFVSTNVYFPSSNPLTVILPLVGDTNVDVLVN